MVQIVMTPQSFEDGFERDEFFEERRREIDESNQDAVASIRRTCGEDPDACARRVAQADEARREAMEAVEVRRDAATVSG